MTIEIREGSKMKKYELKPTGTQKSFYKKAIVYIDNNGTETLYSYDTPIITRDSNGNLVKLWNGWTATTGKHIKAFCGLNKSEYSALPKDHCIDYDILTPLESHNAMMARRNAH